MLGHLVHLPHRARDLTDRRRLHAAGTGHLDKRRVVVPHAVEHGRELFGCVGHELGAIADFGRALLDQHLDLGRRVGRRLRKAPDFDRDDRETLARITGARCLDRGVERQQVGLERDVVDHADDVGDLGRRLRDALHRGVGLGHHDAALFGRPADGFGILTGSIGPIGSLADGRSQLLHRRRGLLDRRGLPRRPLAEVVGALKDFGGGGAHATRRAAQLAHDFGQLVADRIGVVLELGKGTAVAAGHPLRQIGIGEGRKHLTGLGEAAVDGFDQRVDAARQAIELGIGELGGDPVREVAGDGRIDHLAELLLQPRHHGGVGAAVQPAFRFGRLRHLGGLVGQLPDAFGLGGQRAHQLGRRCREPDQRRCLTDQHDRMEHDSGERIAAVKDEALHQQSEAEMMHRNQRRTERDGAGIEHHGAQRQGGKKDHVRVDLHRVAAQRQDDGHDFGHQRGDGEIADGLPLTLHGKGAAQHQCEGDGRRGGETRPALYQPFGGDADQAQKDGGRNDRGGGAGAQGFHIHDARL